MPLQRYGILLGQPKEGRIFPPRKSTDQPHFHIRIEAGGTQFDVAMNIRSSDGSEIRYQAKDRFKPPNLESLKVLHPGLTLTHGDRQLGLDYVRTQGLVAPDQMELLPIGETLPNTKLHNHIDSLIQKAIQEGAQIFVFGQSFANQGSSPNPFWGFVPDQGIHDVHMNQGNPAGRFEKDNGIFQDGGMFVLFPNGIWSSLFIAFQSQSFHTDDRGNPIS